MKHLLLSVMTVCSALSFNASAASIDGLPDSSSDNNQSSQLGIIRGASMKEVVEKLRDVNAYIFLGVNETRDLKETFDRWDELVLNKAGLDGNDEVQWTVTNEGIATLSDNGEITGLKYGETIFTVNDENGIDYHFAVFVCPSITVISPEGVIYKYHKTLNQKARIQLTQGKNYLINCVMLNGQDITASVAKEGNDDSTDGYYESDKGVNEDLVFVISEESRTDDYENSEVIGGSGYNLQVVGHNVRFVDAVDDTPPVPGKEVVVYDHNDTLVGEYSTDNSGIITLSDEGIYKIYLGSGDKTPDDSHFKIIIHDLKN